MKDREKTCAICKIQASQEKSRKLPCGCVLDLGCVVGWMKERKDCPVCGCVFRLMNIRSLKGEERDASVNWEDDGWSEFI